jgi:hypothetical protein
MPSDVIDDPPYVHVQVIPLSLDVSTAMPASRTHCPTLTV